VTVRLDDDRIGERLARLDEVLGELERIPGPTASMALEAVETLAEVYGEALARVMATVSPAGMAPEVASDELIGHLLVLHDLHPAGVEERVERALDAIRPYVRSHGGEVALAAIEDGVARIRLSGTCQSCSSSADTLEVGVREAVLTAAPELTAVEPVQEAAAGSQALIPVQALLRRPVGEPG
jgi:Fe-S cluster biogenesis protein NfuA